MKSVCLDYGHGGRDPGATGNGIQEKDIVLLIGNKITKILERHKVEVIHTRTSDVFVELSERARIANRAKTDIFVSLHCNSFVNSNAQGVEMFAYPNSGDGKLLAKNILDSIVNDKLYTKNRGVKTNNFAVLRETKMTACLVELGFISNKQDVAILINKQDELALAVAKGILKYLGISHNEGTHSELDDQYQKAVKTMVDVGIISSPNAWYNLEKVHVNNVKSLAIKMAAYITQGI